jgi:hypothetical protein
MATQPKPKPAPEPKPGDDDDAASTTQSPVVEEPKPPGGQRQLTFGEKAVGLTFNPSGDAVVHALKSRFAQIIDLCNEERTKAMSTRIASQPSETARLWSIAITEAQGAQMWGVKAATWRD